MNGGDLIQIRSKKFRLVQKGISYNVAARLLDTHPLDEIRPIEFFVRRANDLMSSDKSMRKCELTEHHRLPYPSVIAAH